MPMRHFCPANRCAAAGLCTPSLLGLDRHVDSLEVGDPNGREAEPANGANRDVHGLLDGMPEVKLPVLHRTIELQQVGNESLTYSLCSRRMTKADGTVSI